MIGWLRRRGRLADALVIVASLAVDLLLSANFGPAISVPEKLLILGYAPVGSALLWWRRGQPLAVFFLTCLHALIGTLLVTGYRPFAACLLAVHAVARYSRRGEAHLAMVVSLVPIAAAVRDEVASIPADAKVAGAAATALTYLLFFVLAWQFGLRAAGTQRRTEALQQENLDAARRSAAQERRRLAGELHDVIAHTVTVMMLRAAGGRRAAPHDPEAAQRALGEIEQSGVTALRELRRLIEVIDEQIEPASASELSAVVTPVLAAGIPVDLAGEHHLDTASNAVRQATRRIVQEALTNAIRYGGPAPDIQIRIRWRGPDLEIEVRNGLDLAGGPQPSTYDSLGAGRGLDGMRHRAERLGGSVQAGPVPDGSGWRVRVRFPSAVEVALPS